MKNIFKKTICLALITAFFASCDDDMSVERNTDLSWEIDDDIINQDPRTRIGYDPRLTYVYVENELIEVPMIQIGNINIAETKIFHVPVKILGSKVAEKDMKVKISYNPERYQTLKNTNSDYLLGDENLVAFDATEKIIPQGSQSVDFQVIINNNSSQTNPLILPFTISLVDPQEDWKVFENIDMLCIKLTPTPVEFSFKESEVVFYGYTDGTTAVQLKQNRRPINVTSTYAVSNNITIGLVSDESLLETGLNPLPTEASFSVTPQTYANLSEQQLIVSLQGYENLSEDEYYMPLKAVVYDEDGTAYEQEATINAKVIITAAQAIAYVGQRTATGTRITDKSNIQVSGGYENWRNFYVVNGNYNDWYSQWIYNDYKLTLTLPEVKKLSSVRLKLQTAISNVAMEISEDGTNFTDLGVIQAESSGYWLSFVFSTMKDIKAIRLYSPNQRTYLQEIDFYTE